MFKRILLATDGSPASDHADDGCDLIMVGSHGRSGMFVPVLVTR